ncbi:cytidylate kinase family protein [Geobacter pelophilus]|uniref:Cytidylate kinase family protein n=1 Tax=Geoanaerobacter pelophilus TaxID=60036 RepID=A0AAW4KWK7_9BACT|nr:cytidylate kinase family protein [Geoanaerobacter pelophilus]MBT0662684.1 cytidylate kinase family protein [Geoanaerobacter pelophilus]
MPIITISREMGTGALSIAKDVAKKLKYTLVDGSKISELGSKYGLSPEILERVDEKPPVYITAEDRQQAAYLNEIELIILDLARKGNVIIYGRGGQDLLSGLSNVLRIRFIAPFEERVEMLAEREWMDPDLARHLIRKSDHQRGGFIHFYFNRDWNDPLGYDLIYNTSNLTPAWIVDSIVAAAKDPRFKDAAPTSRELIDNIIINKRVETALLESQEIEYLHFNIESDHGVVTLSGHVHSEDERKSALSIISKVKGVSRVNDQLQVANVSPKIRE